MSCKRMHDEAARKGAYISIVWSYVKDNLSPKQLENVKASLEAIYCVTNSDDVKNEVRNAALELAAKYPKLKKWAQKFDKGTVVPSAINPRKRQKEQKKPRLVKKRM